MSGKNLSIATGLLAVSLIATPAFSEDVTESLAPSPWPVEILYGAKLTSDYNLRSVSQTQGQPAVQSYAEINLENGLYAGFWASNVDFEATDPYAEFDYYGGLRHSFGKLTLDGGYVYIDYIGEDPGPELDFWKIYGIGKYALTDDITVGANFFWTDSFIGFNGIEGPHSSAFASIALPQFGLPESVGTYLSGEIGKQWISDDFAPEYTFWNAGVGFTYKAATLDLRYTGSDLSASGCEAFIGQRDSCGDRFVASLSFDSSFDLFE